MKKYIVSEDQIIAADEFGNTSDRPVIFLHGGGQTRHSWGDTAKEVAQKGFYTVALDARGHGDSSWSASADYTTDAMAEDLKFVISHFSKKPILVGASMGGLVSIKLGGSSGKDLLSGIVLVDIAPKPEQKGIERIFAFMSANMKEGFASIEEAAQAVSMYLPQRAKPKDNSRLEKNLRLRNGRYYWHWDPAMLALWQSITPQQALAMEEALYVAAKKIEVPTLIIRGGMSDVVSEKVMAEFLDAVPNVLSVTVAEAGHMVAGDSNNAFKNAVIHFLENNIG